MTYLTETDTARAEAISARIPSGRELAILEIAEEVSDATGIPTAVITGDSRVRHIAHARQLVYYIAHRAGFSLTEIGMVFRRDHTTILHGIRAESSRREKLNGGAS